MLIDPETLIVIHDPGAFSRGEPESGRFEIHVDRHVAVLEYHLAGNAIVFSHIGVPPALEGQGVGSKLARAGLDYARGKSYRVVPLCSFVASYIDRHPEYQSLVD